MHTILPRHPDLSLFLPPSSVPCIVQIRFAFSLSFPGVQTLWCFHHSATRPSILVRTTRSSPFQVAFPHPPVRPHPSPTRPRARKFNSPSSKWLALRDALQQTGRRTMAQLQSSDRLRPVSVRLKQKIVPAIDLQRWLIYLLTSSPAPGWLAHQLPPSLHLSQHRVSRSVSVMPGRHTTIFYFIIFFFPVREKIGCEPTQYSPARLWILSSIFLNPHSHTFPIPIRLPHC